MAGHENYFKGIKIDTYNSDEESKLMKDLQKYVGGNVTVFCIGTDRSTGDSFAPFVGSYLKERGFENVIGTLDDPVHAMNLAEKIKEIPPNTTVLAVDACVGEKQNIGNLHLKSGAIYAGRGVGKELPPVGDFHIQGVVNIETDNPMMNLQVIGTTRLSIVVQLAKTCANSIENALTLNRNISQELKEVK